MSTTYNDTYEERPSVVVSLQRRRSGCGCVATGCGCFVIVLIIIGVIVALLTPKIWHNFEQLFSDFTDKPKPVVEGAADGQPNRQPSEDAAADKALGIHIPYVMAVARASSDIRITQALGEPVELELIRGSIEPRRFEWDFSLHGPKGDATGKGSAEFDGTGWTLKRLEAELSGGQEVNLLEEYGVDGVEAN